MDIRIRNDINFQCRSHLVVRTSSIVPPKDKILGRKSLLYQAVMHRFLTASFGLKWRRHKASCRGQNRFKIVGCHIWWYGGSSNTSNLHSDFVPHYDGLHEVGRCLGGRNTVLLLRFLLSWFRSRSLHRPRFVNTKLSQAVSYCEFYKYCRFSVEETFHYTWHFTLRKSVFFQRVYISLSFISPMVCKVSQLFIAPKI
jgi:hypothetical protein